MRGRQIRIELGRPARIEAHRRARHRTVDENGQNRDPLRFLQMFQPVQDLLDATDRKRGNDELSAAARALVDDRREPRAAIVGLVHAIAVRGLDKKNVCRADGRRVWQNRTSVSAQIAAE